ncbi:hypothetical protein BpHYR1_036641 [Brachionus plicatilis]|uniref:Uncharacterized protein n=1 Tax=Brachionus plicatilis TaxID=10195 RepID=A0A3M7SMX4_BRAPC|nr:hypothetical protein BpHYR1_036641 [Brachionus plicatilis]
MFISKCLPSFIPIDCFISSKCLILNPKDYPESVRFVPLRFKNSSLEQMPAIERIDASLIFLQLHRSNCLMSDLYVAISTTDASPTYTKNICVNHKEGSFCFIQKLYCVLYRGSIQLQHDLNLDKDVVYRTECIEMQGNILFFKAEENFDQISDIKYYKCTIGFLLTTLKKLIYETMLRIFKICMFLIIYFKKN